VRAWRYFNFKFYDAMFFRGDSSANNRKHADYSFTWTLRRRSGHFTAVSRRKIRRDVDRDGTKELCRNLEDRANRQPSSGALIVIRRARSELSTLVGFQFAALASNNNER